MSSLQAEGFEIIPKLIPAKTILEIGVSLDGVSSARSRAGFRNALRVPVVHSLASDERLVTLARHALGDGAIPFRATLFDKSPQSNWLVVWHQDTALPLRERKDVQGWGPWSVKEGVICAHAPASALEQVLAIRVLMKPLIVHASSKVKSKRARRRVLHIEYAASLSLSNGLELQICL